MWRQWNIKVSASQSGVAVAITKSDLCGDIISTKDTKGKELFILNVSKDGCLEQNLVVLCFI